MRRQGLVPGDSAHPLRFYLAGQRVGPGTYYQIEQGQEVRLDQADTLPATCDGRVAVYLRRPETWGEHRQKTDA